MENRSSDEFSKRTDKLAKALGLSVRDLYPALGMSVSMLFGYRKGHNRITDKAWRKLRKAEIEAGIEARAEEPPAQFGERSGHRAPFKTLVRLPHETGHTVPLSPQVLRKRIVAEVDAAVQAAGDDTVRLAALLDELETRLGERVRRWQEYDAAKR